MNHWVLKNIFIGIAVVGLYAVSSAVEWEDDKDPETLGRLLVSELLDRKDVWVQVPVLIEARPDLYQMIYEHHSGVHYAEACVGMGAVAFSATIKDATMLQAVIDRYLPTLLYGPGSSGDHVDANVYGILPLEIYQQTGDEVWLHEGLRLADVQWEKTGDEGLTAQARWWIDDMWMVASLQTQAWLATGEDVYIDRAAQLLVLYSERLQHENGLFFHGPNSPHHWGRGNGWVASALAFTLTHLPEENTHYTDLLLVYRRMMASLLTFQTENGLWRQLVDNPEAWYETSCTAMFAWAMALGVESGVLTDPAYKHAVIDAWNELTNYVDEEGRVSEVCVGTGKVNSVQFYLDRPRSVGDLHGQAPMLWLANALLDWE